MSTESESAIDPRAEPAGRTRSLLEECGPADHLHCGMVGEMRLDLWNEAQALKVRHGDGEHHWLSASFALTARGPVQQATSRGGWEVFAFGHARASAKQVGELFDGEDGLFDATGEIVLSDQTCQGLGWSLLPSAAVVALHRATGTFILVRDGCGFAPIYYAVQDDRVRFSTNLGAVVTSIQPRGVNTDKISEMLVFAHRSGGRTIWQGVNVVAPGTLVRWGARMPRRIARFWKFSTMFDHRERVRLEQQSWAATTDELRQVIDAAMAPLRRESHVVVPGGGGVDSSFLGAYLSRHDIDTTFRCINQPEADRREQDWMEPLSRELNVSCRYVHVDRERFLWALLETLKRGCQPAVGPNQMGGYLLREEAVGAGESVFASGEMCDTVFGGLSGVYHLSPRFRALRALSKLPRRVRVWTTRAMCNLADWLLEKSMVVRSTELAATAAGHLDRAELIAEAAGIPDDGQSTAQRMCDMLTWHDLVDVPNSLNHLFYERDELQGGQTFYPFADPALVRFGLHLPHGLKYRKGRTKWLWRHYVRDYVGPEVAFRRKYAFPTLTGRWLNRIDALLPGGFLEELLSLHVGRLYWELPREHPSRWTLANVELWGRLHCWNEPTEALLEQLV